jgi:undecaprenyl-diphosphatase
MIERIIQLDKSLFVAINNGLSNPFLDWLCPIIRNQSTWYLLYAIFLYYIIKLYKRKLENIVRYSFNDFSFRIRFSANLVKNTFQRIRPCAEPSLNGITHHLISSCNGYSFISAHATNHFAIAIFISIVLKSYSQWLRLY